MSAEQLDAQYAIPSGKQDEFRKLFCQGWTSKKPATKKKAPAKKDGPQRGQPETRRPGFNPLAASLFFRCMGGIRKITLPLSDRQAQILIDGLDLSSRVMIGQLENVEEVLRFAYWPELGVEKLDHARGLFDAAKSVLWGFARGPTTASTIRRCPTRPGRLGIFSKSSGTRSPARRTPPGVRRSGTTRRVRPRWKRSSRRSWSSFDRFDRRSDRGAPNRLYPS